MYDLSAIATRIKEQAKIKKISMKTLLSDCGLNINAISEMGKGKAMSSVNLAKIADYLGCSVDYLLGREESPQPTADDDELRAQILSRINGLSDPALARTLDFLNGLLAGQETAAGKATDLGRASKSNPESHS